MCKSITDEFLQFLNGSGAYFTKPPAFQSPPVLAVSDPSPAGKGAPEEYKLKGYTMHETICVYGHPGPRPGQTNAYIQLVRWSRYIISL